jgi:hypothetical protein
MGYNLCICGNRKKYSAAKCRDCRYGVIEQPREDITAVEVAWVAGILEGEGCWSQKRASPSYWWIAVRMTDEDIILRLRDLTDIGRITEDLRPGRPGCKKAWAWTVTVKQHREWLTVKVWPWMGERRRARITQLWPGVHAVLTQRQSAGLPNRSSGFDSPVRLAG